MARQTPTNVNFMFYNRKTESKSPQEPVRHVSKQENIPVVELPSAWFHLDPTQIQTRAVWCLCEFCQTCAGQECMYPGVGTMWQEGIGPQSSDSGWVHNDAAQYQLKEYQVFTSTLLLLFFVHSERILWYTVIRFHQTIKMFSCMHEFCTPVVAFPWSISATSRCLWTLLIFSQVSVQSTEHLVTSLVFWENTLSRCR